MNAGGLDAVQMGLISGVVMILIKAIQTANPGGIAPRTALIIAAIVSFLGVGVWTISQPGQPDRTWAFGLFAAWAQTMFAGLGGLVGASAVTPGGMVNRALTGEAVAPNRPGEVGKYD